MRTETRKKFNGYMSNLATLNGIDDASKKFTVDPTNQQKLETRMQESSAFLSMINVIGVDEQSGEKLGLGINSTIAGRTNTSNNDRVPTDPTSLGKNQYFCAQTNFDTALGYARIDAWAKFPDFQTRVRDAILQRQALDRIMIGFNGTSVAAETDRAANPLLQDVNIGWIEKVRTDAPEQILSEGVETSGKIYIDKTDGDYGNLDALVFNMVSEMLPAWIQDDPNLVVVVGRQLLSDKYLPMVNEHAETPTESSALDVIMAKKMIGGLKAVRVPYFPADSLMITTLSNLSLYWQVGARRRAVIDNPKRDRIENYESSNDAYVVEDYEAIAIAENIALEARP